MPFPFKILNLCAINTLYCFNDKFNYFVLEEVSRLIIKYLDFFFLLQNGNRASHVGILQITFSVITCNALTIEILN